MVIKNNYINWKDIPWNKIKLEIYNLQYKIYCHAKKNNIGMLRHYQRQLVTLLEAKLLAVRLVTQDNRTGEICFVHGHCHDEIHSTNKFN